MVILIKLIYIKEMNRCYKQVSLTSKILRRVFQLRGIFWFFGWGGIFWEIPPSKKREKSEVHFLAYLSLNLTKLKLIKLN